MISRMKVNQSQNLKEPPRPPQAPRFITGMLALVVFVIGAGLIWCGLVKGIVQYDFWMSGGHGVSWRAGRMTNQLLCTIFGLGAIAIDGTSDKV